jgi:GTP-binding protein
MLIRSAQFIKGILGTADVSGDTKKPTFAFVGRSNVGKSSVINSLVNRRDLVRSSSTPGRTQEINYFLINNTLYFADLPGYGYAKMPQKQREKIRKLLAWFLGSSEVRIDAVILIIDVNVGLKESDFEVLELLHSIGRKVILIANKADKSGKTSVQKQMGLIRQVVGACELVTYSAKTKQGREELLALLENLVVSQV